MENRRTVILLEKMKVGDARKDAECELTALSETLDRLRNEGAVADGRSRVSIKIEVGDIQAQSLEILQRQLTAKRNLLKLVFDSKPPKPWKAELQDGELQLLNFSGTLEESEIRAYAEFAEKLCDMACKLKKASDKEKPIVNAKYTMRVWLLRLGMIGDEYKQTRAALLGKLEGNSAFLRTANEEISN